MTALRRHRTLTAIWGSPAGWRGTISTVNHSDIGRRFILAAFAFFAIGGVLAMLIRAQLATPDSAFVGPAIYNQLFTMHGSIMMFLFAIPMFEGLALYMLPKMLGARDLAFPRLSAYGWWCYLGGGSILIASLLFGVAPDGGWFMYTPLASKAYTPGINADIWLLGITFVEISAVSAAVELTVSILKLRAPGMRLDRMPLFAWYILVTAGMMIVGFPPLILGSILLEIERAFDWPFFDVARGGSPMLWQHLFWLFGHPEVYIIFLPAAGVVSTILPVMARARIVGYGWLVMAVLALGFLSFGLWVHHMFTTGIPHLALGFFSAASALVAIPSVLQVFAWIATLWNGKPDLRLPMLYLIGFFVVFVLGGLTGVMLAMVPFDAQAHDSYFVVAHLHYVLVGGFIFPMLAAAYYWLPHFTGQRRVARVGEAAFWLIFVGFNTTFFLMHLTGLLGMPRRVYGYTDAMGLSGLNLLSSIGSFVLTIGFALFAIDVAFQIFLSRRTPRNPWQAGTLEWAMPLPAPAYNFASLPHVDDRDPLASAPNLPVDLASGKGYLAEARNHWRETLAVDMTTGAVDHIVILSKNSAIPVLTAMVTGAFFLLMLSGVYRLTVVPLIGVVALGCHWAWNNGSRHDHGPLPIGRDMTARPHWEATGAPGWWGSVFLLVADATLFGSLLFGYAFLWTVAPGWPPVSWITGGLPEACVAVTGIVAACLCNRMAMRNVRGGALPRARTLIWTAAFALVLSTSAIAVLCILRLPAPTEHAYAAVAAVLNGYIVVHLAIATIMTGFVAMRISAGYVSAARTLEPRVASLFTDFAGGVTIVSLAALLLPKLA